MDIINPIPSLSIIGIIHTQFSDPKSTPIQSQSKKAKDLEGIVEIYPQYIDGLKDIEGFSHIFLIYYFNRVTTTQLTVKPYLDTENHGVFATRAPARPNKIGISIVQLFKVQENKLTVKGIDILDNTPLLDLKPFVPSFDFPNSQSFKIGWLEKNIKTMHEAEDDGRFIEKNRI